MTTKIFSTATFIIGVAIVAALAPQSASAASCDAVSLRTAYRGEEGTHIQNMQRCLLALGYQIPAGATGYYGNQTVAALKAFYRAIVGIEWNGLNLGPRGLASLKTAAASSSGSGITRVASLAELEQYISRGSEAVEYGMRGVGVGIAAPAAPSFSESALQATPAPAPLAADSAGRVSETTVQVKGIDEPDIVKTDGTNIYFSREQRYHILPMPAVMPGAAESSIAPSSVSAVPSMTIAPMPPQYESPSTSILKAFPPALLGTATGTIKENGDLLLIKDKKILVVFSYPEFVAYDVTDPYKPQKKWSFELKDSSLLDARLHNGKIYFVLQKYLDRKAPCPVVPFTRGGVSIIVPCADIWRPVQYMPVDVTYTAFVLDPATGVAEKSLTFVGPRNRSLLYMSADNLYVTYYQTEPYTRFLSDFLRDAGTGLFPAAVVSQIQKVAALDIGDRAKLVEIQEILEKHYASVDDNERLRLETELANRMDTYVKAQKRRLEKTTIVKIGLGTFSIAATGEVPGFPLNQFSLDEHNGYLRIAVTVGASWRFGGAGGGSANDVYVLDGNMKIAGRVVDLGLTERIFSARFIGDKGYLVTFRQIDPFYVLDLADPANPKVTGELKIPGFSSFLEAITEDKILGIGREESQVKISLFDVSNPAAPAEKSKYLLNESWTEVQNNHRAFLLDAVHKVFFLPAGNGGYILSYAGDALSLVKAVQGYAVKRAIYLDNYLYVIGENAITVFDEATWEQVKELGL